MSAVAGSLSGGERRGTRALTQYDLVSIVHTDWVLIKTATVAIIVLFSRVLRARNSSKPKVHLVQVHKYTDALINEPFGCHVHVMLGF